MITPVARNTTAVARKLYTCGASVDIIRSMSSSSSTAAALAHDVSSLVARRSSAHRVRTLHYQHLHRPVVYSHSSSSNGRENSRRGNNTTTRGIQTLASNPHIYVHPHPSAAAASQSSSPTSTNANTAAAPSILSYLPSISEATLSLSIASTTAVPPTPASTSENADFLAVLRDVVATHAVHDPDVIAQAQQYASSGGAGGQMFFSPRSSPSLQQQQQRRRRQASNASAATSGTAAGVQEGASGQGGTGGASVGGWIHVADQRNPPDWGRIAYTEDILGSLQVDGSGAFVGVDGNFQWSGAYRIVTNEGILGLSDYLRVKLLDRLRELEQLILSKSKQH